MSQKPATARKKQSRVLPVLALLFAVGASLRVVTGLNAAFAQGSDQQNAASPISHHEAADAPSPAAHAVATAPDQIPHATAQILIDLRQRELALGEREAALAERETLIDAAQGRLQDQITALETAEQDLAATMALADRASEDDISRLVSVFEVMGSEEAAAVFSEMAPDFAAGFLGRLAPESAAAILAGLEPRQAYGLSAILAGRNALVPRD